MLKIEKILVTEVVKTHNHPPGDGASTCVQACGACGSATAEYVINTDTWECRGSIRGDTALVSPVWWEAHCQEVSKRIKAQLGL